jgi:hypothetical protein
MLDKDKGAPPLKWGSPQSSEGPSFLPSLQVEPYS